MNCTPIRKLNWNEKYKCKYNDILNQQFDVHADELLLMIPININHAIDKLNECIIYAAEHSQPQYSINKLNANKCKQPAWFDKECMDLKHDKYDKLNTFHSTGAEEDLKTYLERKRVFKNTCQLKKRMHDAKKSTDIISKFAEHNSKGFWKEIKNMLNLKSNSNKFNEIHPSEWLEHFKDLLGGDDNITESVDVNESEGSTNNDQDDVLNGPIMYEEIVSGINSLKSGKAAGFDGIKPEFYQINNSTLICIIHKIICQIFNSGVYPINWSKSMIIPLHKKGDASDVKNYRGISLINIMSKIFSHILQSRLKAWCESNDLIPEEQAGFRKDYSTIDNIFNLNAVVQKYITKSKGRFYTLFVDFRVAFDSINRDKLWNVLQKDGCHGRMLNIIKSMYRNVMICIRVQQNDMTNCNNYDHNEIKPSGFCITECFQSMCGVKQGCILSPLLFNLYIAELNEHFNKTPIRHVTLLTNDTSTSMLYYADDLAIFADTVFEMQKKIDLLEDFCAEWGLQEIK